MSAGESVEVLIVGAGPVGLAAAIAARQQGLEVRVLERARPPIDKACGEGLMPDAVANLGKLGVDALAAGGRPFLGIRYLDGDVVAEAQFPVMPGVGLRRLALHLALAERAEAVGVRIDWGLAVNGLTDSEVSTDQGRVKYRWLIAADGLRSRLRKWLDLDGTQGSGRFGVRRHYRCEPWTDHVEIHWVDGAEAYVTPVGDEEVGVAMLWPGPKGRFDGLLERFPALAARFADVPASSADRGVGPLEQGVRAVATHRHALVGDASGYVDPITGEGLAVGFKQAHSVARAMAAGDLSLYRREHRRIQRNPVALAKALLAIEKRPASRRRLMIDLASRPEMFRRLLEVHVGERPLSRMGIGSMLRVGRVLLAR